MNCWNNPEKRHQALVVLELSKFEHYYYYYYHYESSSHKRELMVFSLESEWVNIFSSLQDSFQYSVFNNAVPWMVSTRPLISKSSSLSTNPLVTVPRAPITIGITVTFMFHSFSVLKQGLSTYLFSFSFSFTQWSPGTAKSFIRLFFFSFFFFFVVVDSLDLVVWPRLDGLFVSQNLREFCASHFIEQILGSAYTICETSTSCTLPRGSPCPPNRV